MLACVYPAENFKSKAVTVKLRHGRSKRKPKLLSVKEKPADGGKQPECNDTPKLENEVSSPFVFRFPCFHRSPTLLLPISLYLPLPLSPCLLRLSFCLLRVNFCPAGNGIRDGINSNVYLRIRVKFHVELGCSVSKFEVSLVRCLEFV